MIICCPNCGYSGRIRSSALERPFIATCRECRFRFTLHPGLVVSGALARRPHPDLERTDEPEPDPCSSFYELRAITEDLTATDPPAGEHRAHPSVQDGAAALEYAGAPAQASLRNGTAAGLPGPGMSSDGAIPHRAFAPLETWPARLLQFWGLLLLAWAAVILFRDVMRPLVSRDAAQDAGQVVVAVISVVLLVAAAAGLLLVVDLTRARRTTGLLLQATPFSVRRSAIPQMIGTRIRQSWRRFEVRSARLSLSRVLTHGDGPSSA